MGFRYELRLADGDDAGTFEIGVCNWQVGDLFIGQGNRQFRIRAMVPLERIEEFVDSPVYGVWEVEPALASGAASSGANASRSTVVSEARARLSEGGGGSVQQVGIGALLAVGERVLAPLGVRRL